MIGKATMAVAVLCLVWVGCSAGQADEPAGAAPAAAKASEPGLAKVLLQFGPPAMLVAKPASPPVIDGKLDDAAWQRAQPVTLGFLTGRLETPTQKTLARVLADEKAIYFAVQCHEAEPEKVVSAGSSRDDDLWAGDTVEFFLDPACRRQRGKYYHVIVNPKGVFFDSKDGNKAWNGELSIKTGSFAAGWTVEASVPLADLGVAGAIPKVWGLNVNRQRPELGEVAPVRGITATAVPLKEPEKYREGEDTAWSPTYCQSSHIVQRFGHALLEAGTVEVAPPEKLFEIIYKADFDNGEAPSWNGVKIIEESFRGPGKCIAPADVKGPIQFATPLKDLDDVTLILAMKMPTDGRLYYYGRAPDNEQCEADRHEVFMTREAAEARKFPALTDYDTHGSMMAWKSHGRRRLAAGPWAMMTGHFSEPSIGSVMSPGTDWCVLRTRLGMMRRQRSQGLVPLSQNYPRGLTFAAGEPYLIDEVVVFRGLDMEAPQPPGNLKAAREGGQIVLSWDRAQDNTLTAYYQVLADGEKLGETHQLSLSLPAEKLAGKAVTVVAVDFYANASKPSAPLAIK